MLGESTHSRLTNASFNTPGTRKLQGYCYRIPTRHSGWFAFEFFRPLAPWQALYINTLLVGKSLIGLSSISCPVVGTWLHSHRDRTLHPSNTWIGDYACSLIHSVISPLNILGSRRALPNESSEPTGSALKPSSQAA